MNSHQDKPSSGKRFLNLFLSWKFWVGLPVVLLLVWLIFSWYLFGQAATLVFDNKVSWAPIPNYGYEQNYTQNKEGEKISVWYIPNRQTDKVVLYLHGNSGRIAEVVQGLENYATVVSPAYPGYHESEGTPTPEKTYEAALITYDWMVNIKKIPEKNILILGHSMGGSPATYLAKNRPNAKKLILVNTFSSVQSMCFRQFSIFCVFTGGIFNSALNAEEVNIPVRQFVYKSDLTVPPEEGRTLYTYFKKSSDKSLIEIDKYTHTFFDVKEVMEKAGEL